MTRINHGEAAPYDVRRRASYRAIGDQMDAMIKALAHLDAQNIDIGDEGRGLVQHARIIKQRYPKAPVGDAS